MLNGNSFSFFMHGSVMFHANPCNSIPLVSLSFFSYNGVWCQHHSRSSPLTRRLPNLIGSLPIPYRIRVILRFLCGDYSIQLLGPHCINSLGPVPQNPGPLGFLTASMCIHFGYYHKNALAVCHAYDLTVQIQK